jgi:DNA primase
MKMRVRMGHFSDLAEGVDWSDYLDYMAVDYKQSYGVSGEQLNLRECPCCGDDRYRTYINAETGLGNCFKCNETFSPWKLVKALTGAENGKAIYDRLEEFIGGRRYSTKKKPKLETFKNDGWKLPSSFEIPVEIDGEKKNLQYLEERNVDIEMAKYFELRWCLRGTYEATNPNGEDMCQYYNDRVIIPVFDLRGELVTFQGRDMTGKSDRKYLFPFGLPGTGMFLYNGHNARGCEHICMGEGAFDVFAIKRALHNDPSTENVGIVGSFGKHLSYGRPDGQDQLGQFIKLKKLGLKTVTIMWDGEEKVISALIDAADRLSRVGLEVKMAFLPREKDPAEVEPSVVRKAYKNAKKYDRKAGMMLKLKNPYKL